MSLGNLLVRDVLVIRPGYIADEYGNAEKRWDESTSTVVKGWLGRLSESEDHTNREAEVSTWVLRLPAGTDILAGDRVSIDDEVFEVDGRPNRAWTPRGEHHVRVPLRTVDG